MAQQKSKGAAAQTQANTQNNKGNGGNNMTKPETPAFVPYKATLSAILGLNTGTDISKALTEKIHPIFHNDDLSIYPAAVLKITNDIKENDSIAFVQSSEKFITETVATRGPTKGKMVKQEYFDMIVLIQDENTQKAIISYIEKEANRQQSDESAPKSKAAPKLATKDLAELDMDEFMRLAAENRTKMQAAKAKAQSNADKRKENKKNAEKAVITPKLNG